MPRPLEGRVALITGGSRGIGRATSLLLAEQGARVAVNYVGNAAAAEATVAAIRAGGGEAIAVRADVADAAQVEAMVEATVARFGRLDVVVCNAGLCPFKPWEAIPEEEWDRVLAVNLKGTWLTCKAAAPHLRRAGGGRIVIVSSVAGESGGFTTPAHYAASKGGQLALAKTLARVLAADGITVNAIAPAAIATEMLETLGEEGRAKLAASLPVRRLGTPEECAHAILYLVGPWGGFCTGEVIDLNGGLFMD
jgi:3-oxoacyl-[acyl-carrier protein] reductase